MLASEPGSSEQCCNLGLSFGFALQLLRSTLLVCIMHIPLRNAMACLASNKRKACLLVQQQRQGLGCSVYARQLFFLFCSSLVNEQDDDDDDDDNDNDSDSDSDNA